MGGVRQTERQGRKVKDGDIEGILHCPTYHLDRQAETETDTRPSCLAEFSRDAI